MKGFLLALVSLAACETAQPNAPVFHFDLHEAEQYALANHPRIFSAQLTADAVRQQIREARSSFFPQIYGELDAVYAPDSTRLAALNGLNNPSIYSRESDGVTVSQLITDFGRTYELTQSAHFRADAAEERRQAAQALTLLEVDRAYFGLQRAQAVVEVAEETVKARQTSYDQISVLLRNKLRSSLDASFARVDLDQANLLLVQAKNEEAQAESILSETLGFTEAQHFLLSPEPMDLSSPGDPKTLTFAAFQQRPELAALRTEATAAAAFAKAQVSAQYPKVTALGDAGVNPIYDATGLKHNYYSAGINVEIPIATGGELSARAKEAKLVAEADQEDAIELQNTISRDVYISLLNLDTARQRLDIDSDLTKAAGEAKHLAQARYNLGSSSIVELTQAELNQTDAEIQAVTAGYDYQIARKLLGFTLGSLR